MNNKQIFVLSYTVFILILILFACSLPQRIPNEDEAVIASHAYFLDQLGYVKSDLYGGYLKGEYAWENQQFFYHKFFVITGFAFMKIFGFNIYSFKSISLVFMILFFFMLFKYLKNQNQKHYLSIFFAASSFLLLANIFFNHSFIYRPEIMVMSLGFISFFFIRRGQSENPQLNIFLAGVFAGLSAFTHLNGIIYCIAGFLLLVLKKDLKKILIFSIAATIFSLLYFFDINSMYELKALLYQLETDPNVAIKEPFYMGLINEQIRLFHSSKETAFTLVFLYPLILKFKTLKKTHADELLYLLFLFISLGLISHGKTAKYGLNYYPYMAIIAVTGYSHLTKEKRVVKFFGLIILFIFIAINSYLNVKLISRRIAIHQHNEILASLIPEKSAKISAPSVFAFNQIKNFTIRGEIAWLHHYMTFKKTIPRTIETYFDFAATNKDQYVLFDKKTNANPGLLEIFDKHFILNDIIGDYQLIKKSDTYLLFERIVRK